MPTFETVPTAADPRLHEYVGLTDVRLRRQREPANGLFIAEGEKVIRRAVAAGHPVRSVLTARRWLEPLADLWPRLDPALPVFVADEAVLEQVTGFHVHRGALAAMGRLPLPAATDLLGPEVRRLAILEGVNDHTNVGAIVRGAAALGVDALLLSPDCADPLYRRAVKVSMGAVFALRYARLDPWPRGLEQVRAAGFRLLALTPDPTAVPLSALARPVTAQPSASAPPRLALMLGAEGPGLSARALAMADVRVRIPMAAGVDSLNVAAAAAVAFYALAEATDPGAAQPGPDRPPRQGADGPRSVTDPSAPTA